MLFKFLPEDFIVTERLDLKLDKTGSYVYIFLEKRNLTTLLVVSLLSKALHISFQDIGYAGLKDKKGITRQYFSLRNVSYQSLEALHLEGISLKILGRGKSPIKLGDLKENVFDIIVRDVTTPKTLSFLFLENYFDEQRFSSVNVDVGRALLRRDFKKACVLLNLEPLPSPLDALLHFKKIVRLCFHSYQSYLFNKVLALLLEKYCLKRVSYSLGEFIFVEQQPFSMPLPLLNFDTPLTGEVGALYNTLLHEEGFKLEDFVIKQLPFLISDTLYREAFVPVQEFFFEPVLHGVKLHFVLPKGSYATLVIKKIFG